MIESIFLHPWVWIVPAILVALAVTIIICVTQHVRIEKRRNSFYDDPIGWIVGWILSGFVFLFLATIYFGFMLPPYDMSFHHTYRVSGEITEHHAAFEGGDGVATNSYVLEVEGVDYQIYSTTQRLRTYEVGDDVTLVCVKIFNYFQEPYLDCAIGGK